MVDPTGATSINSVCEGPAFIDCDRREVDAIGDIPNGIDVGDIRALIRINGDAAILKMNARTLKT